MNTTIYIRDHREAVLNEALNRNNEGHQYTREELTAEIDRQARAGLRYSTKTGAQRDDDGICAQWSGGHVPKYKTDEEAAVWEFTGRIRSGVSAKRYRRSIISGKGEKNVRFA